MDLLEGWCKFHCTTQTIGALRLVSENGKSQKLLGSDNMLKNKELEIEKVKCLKTHGQ